MGAAKRERKRFLGLAAPLILIASAAACAAVICAMSISGGSLKLIQNTATKTSSNIIYVHDDQAVDGLRVATAQSLEEAPPSADGPPPPKVEDMIRAQREIRDRRDYTDNRGWGNDPDVPEHWPVPDHHYYSGPATSRRLPTTDIRAKSTAGETVASFKEEGTGSSISSGQAMYRPPEPPPVHDYNKDVERAAEENPTRRAVARALEHIQTQEIASEYFHDTLVDNDADSWHYQQPIHVPLVAGSLNQGTVFSWNGIGGLFGLGGALGPSDTRSPVALHAKQDPISKRYYWRNAKRLDVERVLQTGASFNEMPRFGFGTKDVAQQVLRDAMPEVIKPQFLGYNPAAPPPPRSAARAAQPPPSYAAYTAEGSRRLERAARGEAWYREWARTHPKQARDAGMGRPCFDGRVPCQGPYHPGRAWYYDAVNRTGLT